MNEQKDPKAFFKTISSLFALNYGEKQGSEAKKAFALDLAHNWRTVTQEQADAAMIVYQLLQGRNLTEIEKIMEASLFLFKNTEICGDLFLESTPTLNQQMAQNQS